MSVHLMSGQIRSDKVLYKVEMLTHNFINKKVISTISKFYL